jgi:chemotaxis protein methyltransferase CheR
MDILKHKLSDRLLNEMSIIISTRMGLYFPRENWHKLEHAISKASNDLGYATLDEFVNWFITTPFNQKMLELMVGYLTIGETYFFRESASFAVVEHDIIPELMRTAPIGKKHIRIWSAGCSTGEEPYSIAMLLYKMREKLEGYDITILATDINHNSLTKAKKGVYSEWSFRSTSSWIKDNYFNKTVKGHYEVKPEIKKMVEFSYLNLAEDHYPSMINDTNAMNIIFCRNVLMYFKPDTARSIVDRLSLSMNKDAWLFVSACESSNSIFKQLHIENRPGVICYRNKKETVNKQSIHKMISPIKHKISRLNPIKKPGLSGPIKINKTFDVSKELYHKGFYDEAYIELKEFLVHTPNDTKAIGLICRILANKGKLGEALNYAESGLTIDKLDDVLHYLKAVILIEKNLEEDAIKSLKNAIYINQNFIVAYFTLGNIFTQKGDKKAAQMYFNSALSLIENLEENAVIPETDGLSADRFREIIQSTIDTNA